MSNYRPISILTCFCKIVEKLVYHRLNNFFEKHSVFTKSQYGFQNNSSITHASLDIETNAFDHINNNHYSCLVFLDYNKAFDIVCHNILLQKLDHYGIREVANNLITSYLSDQKQFILHQGEKSDIVNVKFGVPQGSNLGPLIFLFI